MDDRTFLTTLNGILHKDHLILPALEAKEPEADTISAWATFLERAVRSGVRLSDPRWSRLTVTSADPHTVFDLQSEGEEPATDDFAVGLQLLVGLLEDDRS